MIVLRKQAIKVGTNQLCGWASLHCRGCHTNKL